MTKAEKGVWNAVEAARKEQQAALGYKKEIDATLENKEK